jgi:hypothetical protein
MKRRENKLLKELSAGSLWANWARCGVERESLFEAVAGQFLRRPGHRHAHGHFRRGRRLAFPKRFQRDRQDCSSFCPSPGSAPDCPTAIWAKSTGIGVGSRWLGRCSLFAWSDATAGIIWAAKPLNGSIHAIMRVPLDEQNLRHDQTSQRILQQQQILLQASRAGHLPAWAVAGGWICDRRTTWWAAKNWSASSFPPPPIPPPAFLVLVPESEILKLDMSVADGIKFIISLGAISPDHANNAGHRLTASPPARHEPRAHDRPGPAHPALDRHEPDRAMVDARFWPYRHRRQRRAAAQVPVSRAIGFVLPGRPELRAFQPFRTAHTARSAIAGKPSRPAS